MIHEIAGLLDRAEQGILFRTLSRLQLLHRLQERGLLTDGVAYDPYSALEVEGPVLALFRDGETVESAQAGEKVEILLPQTCFYIASGGQVSDTGKMISTAKPEWEARVVDMRKPAAGMIVHVAEIEHQIEGAHVLEQINSCRGQRSWFICAAAIARAHPRRADQAHAAFIPPLHFCRFADRVAAFDEIH